MIYLASYALSVLFAHFAARTKRRSNFIVFSIISIAITVALAGLRDYSIGIDTQNYLTMERFWAGAIRAESLSAYLGYYLAQGYKEPLFALIIGVIAQTAGEFRVFLFVAHAVIITGVYIGAFRMKEYINPAHVLLLFYLLYYNNSLNIMRQYIAMAIIFTVFADLEKRKYFRYIFVVLISMLIHTTAVLALVPLCIHLFLYRRQRLKEAPLMRKIIIFMAIVVFAVFFIPLVRWVMDIGILPSKYNFFFKNIEYKRMAITRAVLLALEIIGLFLCYKSMKRYHPHADFYVLCTVFFLALQQVATFILYGNRVSGYFSFINIITLCLLGSSQKKAMDRKMWFSIIAAFCLYYWRYQYVQSLSSETFPYILGVWL